jgi:hypothetical protein
MEDGKVIGHLVFSGKAPWWRRIRNPFSFRWDRKRKRGWVGLNFRIGWFELLWFFASWGFGRPSFCLRLLGGRRAFSALLMWDTAHVSRLGKAARWLTPLQSVLWFSFTGWTTGGATVCQGQA